MRRNWEHMGHTVSNLTSKIFVLYYSLQSQVRNIFSLFQKQNLLYCIPFFLDIRRTLFQYWMPALLVPSFLFTGSSSAFTLTLKTYTRLRFLDPTASYCSFQSFLLLKMYFKHFISSTSIFPSTQLKSKAQNYSMASVKTTGVFLALLYLYCGIYSI